MTHEATTTSSTRPRKRRWLSAALAGMFVLGIGAGVYAKDVTETLRVRYRNIKLLVDGSEITSDTEPFIVIDEGRTYLGARALAEALGATVEWDDASSTIIVTSSLGESETRSGDRIVYKSTAHRIGLSVPGTWQRLTNSAVAIGYADPVTASNVTLAVTPAEAGKTLDALTDEVINTIKAIMKTDTVSDKTVTTVAGVSARRFELTVSADGAPLRQQTYVFAANGNLYVLGFSATTGQFANFESTFNTIRDSVQVQ